MNYELAKQLKCAGFPQNEEWGTLSLTDENGKEISERVKVPQLGSLIEACGDDFESLTKMVTLWEAKSKISDILIVVRPSPEGAVANLWLLLNKK